MYTIARHPQFSQFIIKQPESGAVPKELSGLYTNRVYAQAAVDEYSKRRAVIDSAKEDRADKKEESLAKPLGFTQRKKPNAKKPSTPRK